MAHFVSSACCLPASAEATVRARPAARFAPLNHMLIHRFFFNQGLAIRFPFLCPTRFDRRGQKPKNIAAHNQRPTLRFVPKGANPCPGPPQQMGAAASLAPRSARMLSVWIIDRPPWSARFNSHAPGKRPASRKSSPRSSGRDTPRSKSRALRSGVSLRPLSGPHVWRCEGAPRRAARACNAARLTAVGGQGLIFRDAPPSLPGRRFPPL